MIHERSKLISELLHRVLETCFRTFREMDAHNVNVSGWKCREKSTNAVFNFPVILLMCLFFSGISAVWAN